MNHSTLMHPILSCFALTLMVLIAPEALSQQLPNVLPDGIDTSSSDPTSVLIAVVKFVISIVLWISVALLAAKTIIEAIKDIKEARDGDSKWVSAGKSIAGGIFFFLIILAMALWIQGAFLG